jgi:ribosomal protein L11 methyltransferase
MSWIEIKVTAQSERDAEAVAEVLQLFALDGEWIATEQLGDPNDVRADALLAEMVVKLVIDVERDDATLRRQIAEGLSARDLPSATFHAVDETEWATAWRANFHPLQIGERFWIRPSWEPLECGPANLVITLDPGNAFGTGTHETTQLCLTQLERHVNVGDSVLDLGCGSGILAIGAALLGASPVLAVDIDSDSVVATVENSRINAVAAQIAARQGSLDVVKKHDWDVLVANILAPTLIEMLTAEDSLLSYVAPDGVLILSGVLGVQSADLQQAIQHAGGVLHAEFAQGDWIAQIVKHAKKSQPI